jgi:hypothetical protein
MLHFKNEQCGERFQIVGHHYIHGDSVVEFVCGDHHGLTVDSTKTTEKYASMFHLPRPICPQINIILLQTPCMCGGDDASKYRQWINSRSIKLDVNATVKYSFLTTLRKSIENMEVWEFFS